jgi:hypothetical protein
MYPKSMAISMQEGSRGHASASRRVLLECRLTCWSTNCGTRRVVVVDRVITCDEKDERRMPVMGANKSGIYDGRQRLKSVETTRRLEDYDCS